MPKNKNPDDDMGPREDAPLFDFEPEGERFSAFKAFHLENPVVFDLFRRFANDARRAGRTHFGARMIGERIRWYTSIETTDQDYKLNDHYWPYYARLLVIVVPDFDAFFEFRDARFDATTSELRAFARACGLVTT